MLFDSRSGLTRLLIVGLLAAFGGLLPGVCRAQIAPSDRAKSLESPAIVEPMFLFPEQAGISDYRPVLNADASVVVFERTRESLGTELYTANLVDGKPHGGAPHPFTGVAGSSRADWCWRHSGGNIASGPLAFSAESGVYVTPDIGASPTLLPNTAGMIYPAWFPDCSSLAVDNAMTHVTAIIGARTGKMLVPHVGDQKVWAGFPSVNQADPNLIAFAGQYNADSNYYNQELNYTWVADTSQRRVQVFPMDQHAPKRSGFVQSFQARAGWWSPDGRWFAFESNRACKDIEGKTYAIFIQDSAGMQPAMQVTSCNWNAQHPKWFPPGTSGGKSMLIAAVAVSSAAKASPFRIATLDVTAFVGGR